jgi:hypothetical protein
LAGYAVECGLKSRIAGTFRRSEWPDKKFVDRIYTHSLELLLDAAALKVSLSTAIAADAALGVNWAIVKDWSEQSRYSQWTMSQAGDLITAIGHPQHGVMRWLRANW